MGGNGRASDSKVIDGPFARDTGQWTLNIRTEGEPDYLRRAFGRSSPSLPTPASVAAVRNERPYDVAPWNDTSSSGFRNRLEGWISGPQLHNLVHVWVGGSMLPMTSPNDPVFWLNHCFVDLLWAEWQARYPSESYLPIAGAEVGHNLNDAMHPWNQPGDTVRPKNVLDHHALGYIYDTETQDILPGSPVAQGQWGTIVTGHVLHVMQDGRVLDWVPSNGSWRLWDYRLIV